MLFVGSRRTGIALGLAGLVAAGVVLANQFEASADSGGTAGAGQFVYRVSAPGDAEAQRLVSGGFDLLERRAGADLFVMGDSATAKQLRKAGFSPKSTEKLPATLEGVKAAGTTKAAIDETYAGGYHTVNAHYAHLDAVVKDHADLAKVVDFGDSYRKSANTPNYQFRLYGTSGYDMKAICLTHRKDGDCALKPNSTKPRFLLMAQMHAREIVTGDIAWRFIDHLVKDSNDSAVSKLLDTTEVWVVPIANPDGADRVQQGGNQPLLQRKNMHGSGCGNTTASRQLGVDLNRNANHRWGTTGVSKDVCDQTYPGTKAESEPETVAITSLIRKLFPDQRGTGDSAAAPTTARGTMLTLHSYAGMVLLPWGSTNKKAPNDAKLRAIAAKMASSTGYEYGQAGELLYTVGGATDDWAYDELGLASFTIEVGSCNSFTPSYSCAASDYKTNLPALMYLASMAKGPYA